MPEVKGRLLDIGLASLDALRPVITFTPKNENGDGTSIALTDVFIAGRAASVRPDAAGNFSIQLAATTLLRPETWYEISVSWFEPTGGFLGASYPAFKLRVPEQGGLLTDLLDAEPTARLTWVGTQPPSETAPYLWWIDTSTIPPVLKEWTP